MGVVLQRGFKDKRGLVSKNDDRDESTESKRELEILEAMEVECARRLLCVCCGWGNCF